MARRVVSTTIVPALFTYMFNLAHNTLFRGNTTFTKTMELAMEFYGRALLGASIGKIVRKLCSEKIPIEVDPVRIGKGQKNVERCVEELVKWCQAMWDSIYANRNSCPQLVHASRTPPFF